MISFISVLGILSFNALALTFSSDTITAYDSYYWGRADDDTVLIINPAGKDVVIDSILVEFDTVGYEEFSIAWIESDTRNEGSKRAGYYTISEGEQLTRLQRSNDVNLNDYNSGIVPKRTIEAGDTITMCSPYFSKNYSYAGIILECWESWGGSCVPSDADLHYAYFPGRMIFIIENNRDTLHLDCEQFWVTTGVKMVPVKPYVGNAMKKHRFVTVDLSGKILSDLQSCSPSVYVRKDGVFSNGNSASAIVRMTTR